MGPPLTHLQSTTCSSVLHRPCSTRAGRGGSAERQERAWTATEKGQSRGSVGNLGVALACARLSAGGAPRAVVALPHQDAWQESGVEGLGVEAVGVQGLEGVEGFGWLV